MAIPSTSGSYVGEHRDGYFWNGTSWEPGESVGGTTAEDLFRRQATASAPAPNTAFGGAIINQQNATPAQAPAPAVVAPPSDAKRASILATIMRNESGGRNVPQRIDDINMRNGDPAQGFYQITGGTWRDFGGDKTGHKSAIEAPYDVQLQIAQNIPVERWGPATQQALKSSGYEPKPGETLGQMLARYNEDPAATRPEDVGGSRGTAVAAAVPPPSAGLLMPTASQPIDAAAKVKSEQEKAQDALYAGLTKSGMGLLEQATPAPPAFEATPGGGIHRPDPRSAPPLPNYRQQAQAVDPFMEMLMRQRLRRV